MQTIVTRQGFLSLAMVAVLAVSLAAQTPLIDQGSAAINRGDNDGAIEILEKAVAQSPNSAEAHYYLANAYAGKLKEGGMMAAAKYASKIRDEYEKAVTLNPKHVEAHLALVQVYAGAPAMMGGSFEKAFAHAAEIKSIDPLVGHRAYAFIYSRQQKFDLAEKEHVDAIHEQPNSAKAHTYYGQYLTNVAKNYPKAFQEFETALKLDSNYMPAFYHFGRTASLADSNLARGEESLKKYLGYAPAENEPGLANAHYFLGTVYEKEGKKAEAKQAYEAALKLNPSLKSAAEALKRVS